MKNYWIIVNKQSKVTSTDVVRNIKRQLKQKITSSCANQNETKKMKFKIGHGGTLDPLATGVLPIACEETTKFIAHLHTLLKVYEFDVCFGEKRTTADIEGDIIQRSKFIPTKLQIENVLSNFIGNIQQVPPKYSACKVNGVRAYKLARENVDFTLEAKSVYIENLRLISYKNNLATMQVTCGSGVYVRSLAENIATELQSLAYVTRIHRSRYGEFTNDNAYEIKNELNLNCNYVILLNNKWTNRVVEIDHNEFLALSTGKIVTREKINWPNFLLKHNEQIIGLASMSGDRIVIQRMLHCD